MASSRLHKISFSSCQEVRGKLELKGKVADSYGKKVYSVQQHTYDLRVTATAHCWWRKVTMPSHVATFPANVQQITRFTAAALNEDLGKW